MLQDNKTHAEQTVNVLELIRILYRNRWSAIAVAAIVILAAAVYLQFATRYYTSKARLYVERESPKLLFDSDEGRRPMNYLHTEAAFLRSAPILCEALDLFHERTREENVAKEGGTEELSAVRMHLHVEVGKDNDILTVGYESSDPYRATLMTESIVQAYIDHHSRRKQSTAAELLRILKREKQQREAELVEKTRLLTDFKRTHTNLVFGDKKENIIMERLSRLSKALTDAQLETLGAQAAYESTQTMMQNPATLKQFVESQRSKHFYVATADDTAILQNELNKLDLELANLKLQLTDDHPAVRALEEKMAKMRQQMTALDEEFAEAQLSSAHQEYRVAQQKEAEIRRYFDEQYQLALEYNEQYAQYALLESEWEQVRRMRDALSDRIKEIDVGDDAGAMNISVLEPAQIPVVPSSPQRARLLILAMIFGCVSGCGVAMVRDVTDMRMHSDAEVQAVASAPVLAVIPEVRSQRNRDVQSWRAFLESNSLVAEAYRRIRTFLIFGSGGKEFKTVLVTSAERGEGKTTVASNLAMAMAKAGQKTLLIDADFRRPMLTRLLGVRDSKGLSAVLYRQSPLRSVMWKMNTGELHFITCGDAVEDSCELLNSDRFSRLLTFLSERFDRIVIDSPPLLCVTDSQVLAALCDTTLLVMNARMSRKPVCRRAREELAAVNAHVAGVIMNEVSPRRRRKNYYLSEQYEKSKKAYDRL